MATKFRTKGLRLTFPATGCVSLILCACLNAQEARPRKDLIRSLSSSSMVGLMQVWAEAYSKIDSNSWVEVYNGNPILEVLFTDAADVFCSDRSSVTRERIAKAEKNAGKKLKQFHVGYDALAFYVHEDNPLSQITLDQLAQIYAREGKITNWSQLGVAIPGASDQSIACVSRYNSSSAYWFFREDVLNKQEFKAACREMHTSKEVLEFVSKTPTAIGYARADAGPTTVKMLKLAAKSGMAALAPTVEHIQSKRYPLVRDLHVYTLDDPRPAVKRFADWTLSDAGQKIVEENGFVPIAPQAAAKPPRNRP